jgi:hypothetical protein
VMNACSTMVLILPNSARVLEVPAQEHDERTETS